jgi:endo-1,4-beta-xylanase
VNGINNNATLQQVMQNHISTLMGRYKGKCYHWDVVNEGMFSLVPSYFCVSIPRTNRQKALNEDGSYRDNVFLRVVGEAYLPISFRMAAAADSTAKLYYNDYNLEYGDAKAKGAVKIVKLVQSYGVKIDGVGLQGHMVSEPTGTQSTPCPSREVLGKALKMFTDLGVDVAYTEVDVRMKTPATAAKLQRHAQAYADMAGACIDNPRCVGFTVWGVSDKYSWVPNTFSGVSLGCLYSNRFPSC